MGFVRWCWVKGSPNQVFDSLGKRDYSKYRQRCISPLLPRRLIWSVQKIFPEICQRREDWERSINYPGIESSASRYIIEFLVWNMKWIWVIHAGLWGHIASCLNGGDLLKNKNFGHYPSPRYSGNHGWWSKDILGEPKKVALVEIYVYFAVFAFWGF